MHPTPGIEIGPYQVEALLGSGGMGEVYLARDTRLERRVAIKRLTREAGASNLLREARAAAALNHPNIAAIYDVLDTPQGAFIVMEYVEGETLSARLARGRLAPAEAVAIARQLCAGMAAAHDAGIVHRDLKPSNVCLTAQHVVKVLDFGVARRMAGLVADVGTEATGGETTLSTNQRLVGTPAYMAPEQMVNGPVDARTDVYAIGMLLYQMLTGVRPFANAGGDIVAAALARVAPLRPPSAVEASVPSALDGVVTRALEPEPADRYASARELDTALADAQRQLAEAPTEPIAPPAVLVVRRWRRTASLLALAALVAAAIGVWRARQPASPTAGTNPVVVAVLPFEAEAADARSGLLGSYVADSVAATLRPTLGLNVLAGSAMDEVGDAPDSAGAGRRLGADFVVRGRVARRAADVRVGIEVLRAGATSIWHGERVAPPTGIRELVRLLATDVRGAIAKTGSLNGTHDVAAIVPEVPPDTENEAAYADFEQGRSFLLRSDVPGNVDRAMTLFEAAVAKDPRFAAAHARLGQARLSKYAQTNDAEWVTRSREAFLEALRLDPARAEVRLALATLHQAVGRSDLAIEELRRAARDAPATDEPHRRLAGVLIDRGRFEEAVAELQQAIALRPNYFNNHSELGYAYYRAGRFEEAAMAYTRVTELQPDSALGFHMLGTTQLSSGQLERALESYQTANALRPSPQTLSNIGTVHFWRREYRGALTAYEAAVRLAPGDADLWANLGDVQRRLGRGVAARMSYQRAASLFEQRLRVNAQDAFALAQLGLLAIRLGEPDTARHRLDAALRAGPNDPDVLRTVAVVRLLGGDRPGACQAIERALSVGLGPIVLRHDEDLAVLSGGCDAYDRAVGRVPAA